MNVCVWRISICHLISYSLHTQSQSICECNQTSLHPSPNAIVYLRMSEWISANRVFSLPWIKLWVDFFYCCSSSPPFQFHCISILQSHRPTRRHSSDGKWYTISYERRLNSEISREMNDGRYSVSLPSQLIALLGSCSAECIWTAVRVDVAHVPLEIPLMVKFILYQKIW